MISDITFVQHDGKACSNNGVTKGKPFMDLEECRSYCASNNECVAYFQLTSWFCFASNACTLRDSRSATVYVKTVV